MQKIYVGIDQDRYGGMTAMGAIIKDAWVFSLLPGRKQAQDGT